MVERVISKKKGGGNYFAAPIDDIEFIHSGCHTLDLALGGGWAKRRIANIVGDKSTAKTLLCIEASINFAAQYPKGIIRYRECESAFSKSYAGALGMPIHRVDFGRSQIDTVEDFFEDMSAVIAGSKPKQPELYILDSLDSLSDRAEMDRDIDASTYGTGKASKMSQLFRRLASEMADADITLIIVSQVRSIIGMSFGRKTTRSGGRALDFYSSQVLYLQHIGRVYRSIKGIGVKRETGINVKAKLDKNKVALPFREAQFEVTFGYGIDDLMACIEWLKEVKSLPKIGVAEKDIKTYVNHLRLLPDEEYAKAIQMIHDVVTKRWYEIESLFMPNKSKYTSNVVNLGDYKKRG